MSTQTFDEIPYSFCFENIMFVDYYYFHFLFPTFNCQLLIMSCVRNCVTNRDTKSNDAYKKTCYRLEVVFPTFYFPFLFPTLFILSVQTFSTCWRLFS